MSSLGKLKEGIPIKQFIQQLFSPLIKLKLPQGTSKEEAKKIVNNFVVRFVIASMALDWIMAIVLGGGIAYLLTLINFTMFSFASTWMLMVVLILLIYYTYASYENNRQATYDNVMLRLMAQYVEGENNGEND